MCTGHRARIRQIREEGSRKRLIDDAKRHIADCKAMIALIENYPDYAVELKMKGIKIGLCSDAVLIILLSAEIKEAEKAINNEPNKFE